MRFKVEQIKITVRKVEKDSKVKKKKKKKLQNHKSL